MPKIEGKCDKCGGELIQRADDVPETIQNRLNVYHEQTEPIKAYYEKLGLLVSAKGENELEDTTKNVMAALGLGE
jgi:adenylate kinase